MGIHKRGIKNKYGNKKCVVDGIKFDSVKEARYYCELKVLRLAGEVLEFAVQPAFPIVVNKKKICTYRADFRVKYSSGLTEFVDVKGFKTPVYRLKKKLVEAIYGIEIVEH